MQNLLFLLLIIFAKQLSAQVYTGKVINKHTSEPLHYAHITCPETGEAAITDESGNFRLLVKSASAIKTLQASFVGYQTVMKAGYELSNGLIFELPPDTTVLASVEITAPDPLDLIQQALGRLQQNHGGAR